MKNIKNVVFLFIPIFSANKTPSQNSVSAKHLGKKLTTVKFRIDMNVLKLHFIYKEKSHTNFLIFAATKLFTTIFTFNSHHNFPHENRAHIIKMMHALPLFIHILYFFFIFKYFLKLITTTLRK